MKTKPIEKFGGAKRDRTADLYNAIVALSQLSYSPIVCSTIEAPNKSCCARRASPGVLSQPAPQAQALFTPETVFFFTDPARLFNKYHAVPGGCWLAIIFIIKAWQQLVIIADIILNDAGAIGILIDLIIIKIDIISIIIANDNGLG